MENNKKNPLLAGVYNVLLPGSAHIYVRKERKPFIVTFIIAIVALSLAIWIGIQIQNVQSFQMIQGICPGSFVLIILAIFFKQGLDIATENNTRLVSQEQYQKSRYHASKDEKIEKIEQLKDNGLISDEQYNIRKEQIFQKNKEE